MSELRNTLHIAEQIQNLKKQSRYNPLRVFRAVYLGIRMSTLSKENQNNVRGLTGIGEFKTIR